MTPEMWLPARTTTFKRWRDEMEAGKTPEKLLSFKKRDLRLTRPERSGIWPEMELPLKLRTRS